MAVIENQKIARRDRDFLARELDQTAKNEWRTAMEGFSNQCTRMASATNACACNVHGVPVYFESLFFLRKIERETREIDGEGEKESAR